MPPWLTLVLSIAACTLVVPLWVLGQSSSPWRALAAWRSYAKWMALLYAIGGLTWVGIMLAT